MGKNNQGLILIRQRAEKGFTLIELLVVIAIIGMVATLGVGSYQTSLKRARDAQRKADLKQIRMALEMYYADNGYYPASSCGWDCNGYYYSNNGGDNWIPGLAPYLNGRIPKDPKNTGGAPWDTNGYIYAYGNVGRYTYPGKFDLTAQLENTNDPDRCQIKQWKFWFNSQDWCGPYSNYIYEDSPQ